MEPRRGAALAARTRPAAGAQRKEAVTEKKVSGFRTMTPERMREVASMGGREAHRKGSAHKFSPEEASAASKKGWAMRRKKNEASVG